MSSVIELDSSDDDVTLVTQEKLPKRKKHKKQYHIPKKYHVGVAMQRLFNLCISLEDSDGMERIIYKNILPHFKHCDKEYLDSAEFQKFLFDITERMKGNNNRKFSCLKELSEKLKENRIKKRVELVTLDSEVSETTKRKHDIETSYERKRFKSNTDTNSNQELKQEERMDKSAVILLTDEDEDSDRSANNTPVIEIDDEKENSDKTNTFKINSQSDEEVLEPSQSLLSPTCHKIVDPDAEDEDRRRRIETVTNLINAYHRKIRRYEMKEVDCDENTSPYIACHRLKEELIILYKELSDLEGTDYLARKEKNIRLKVAEGHLPGPAKMLEHWLNKNTVNGVPPFPDFTDVVKCVVQANTQDNLGWTPRQIYREARMLLIQCGEDLQARRQKREWCHMKQLMEGEMVDPADHDAELRAKLERNRVIAKKNEHNIIQRFVDLESQNRQKKVIQKNNSTVEHVTELVNNENEGLITNNVHEANDKTDLNNVVDSKDKPTVSRLDVESKSIYTDESTDNESEVDEENITDDNKILNKTDNSQTTQIDSKDRQEENKELNKDTTGEVVKVKSEIKMEQDVWDQNCEDVFEAMLKSEFVDGNFETNIFDIEEKVITIEISSSESEYDSDEEC